MGAQKLHRSRRHCANIAQGKIWGTSWACATTLITRNAFEEVIGVVEFIRKPPHLSEQGLLCLKSVSMYFGRIVVVACPCMVAAYSTREPALAIARFVPVGPHLAREHCLAPLLQARLLIERTFLLYTNEYSTCLALFPVRFEPFVQLVFDVGMMPVYVAAVSLIFVRREGF